jgi:hypothetical protein
MRQSAGGKFDGDWEQFGETPFPISVSYRFFFGNW